MLEVPQSSGTYTYAATLSEALAGMDPDEVERMIRPGDDTPPTLGGMCPALMTRLRDLAASGPVILELNCRTVKIEQDGPVLLDHRLAPAAGSSACQAASFSCASPAYS